MIIKQAEKLKSREISQKVVGMVMVKFLHWKYYYQVGKIVPDRSTGLCEPSLTPRLHSPKMMDNILRVPSLEHNPD